MPFVLGKYKKTKKFTQGGSVLPADLNNIQDDIGTVAAGIHPAPVAVLPTLPHGGDDAHYTANTLTGNIWSFKYRPTSEHAYKWELIGGTPLITTVATQQAVGVENAWTNLQSTFAADGTVTISNPTFATNTTSWTATVNGSITRDTVTFDTTPASGLWVTSASGGILTETTTGTFTVGKTYRLTIRFKGPTGIDVRMEFGDLTTGDRTLSNFNLINTSFNTMTLDWTPIAPSSAVTLRLTRNSFFGSQSINIDSLVLTSTAGTVAGPDVIIPLTGEYLVSFGANANKPTNTSTLDGNIGVAIGDTNPGAEAARFIWGSTSSSFFGYDVNSQFVKNFAAGDIARVRYLVSSLTPVPSFRDRYLSVLPIRVL